MSTANSSTVRTGHGGRVMVAEYVTNNPGSSTFYLIARITQWSVNPTATEATWADSDSEGYTNRRTGRRDCTGSMTGKLDKDHPAYQNFMFAVNDNAPENNDTVTLALWEDGNITTPVKYWYFPRAVITNYTMSFDMDTRDPVEWSADFGADGIYYKPGDAKTATTTLASAYKTIDETET